MEDLLDKKIKNLGLKSEHKDMLSDGLRNECFNKTAKEVALKFRKKGQHGEALALTDISPLFDPHNFWHNQLKKMNEKIDSS